ncbi:flagellar biosynthetic protein FliR [Buchnera aphidicola]|uniref:flagellar biosynthetic protein FliR n=1 Tax=Buchnera aphidicola TaxID=9 RepID=UPI0031B88B7B
MFYSYYIFFLDYILPIMIRVLGLISIAPIFSEKIISYKSKIFISFILSFFIFSLIPKQNIFLFCSKGFFIFLEEFLVGFFLGLIFKLVFVVSIFSGDLINSQIGLSFSLYSDNNNRCLVTTLSQLINCFTGLLFLIFDMHLWIISIIVKSFYYVPIGSFLLKDNYFKLILFFKNIFIDGLMLFFPVLILLIILNFIILFLNRIISSLSFFSFIFLFNFFFGIIFLYFFYYFYIFSIKLFFQKILFFLLNIL